MLYRVSGIACCVLSMLTPFSHAQTAAQQAEPVGPCERPAWTADAVQARDFGTLKLELVVDDTGRVIDARVLASTQSRSLDRAGLAKVRGCKFLPQYASDGKRVALSYTFSWPYSELSGAKPLAAGEPLTADAPATARDDCNKPEYPLPSLRKEEQGEVEMAFLIDTDGRVVGKKVVHSSGFPMLDDAALTGIAMCYFNPAKKNGVPAKAWINVSYRWTLI